MPLYEYRCRTCGFTLEVLQKAGEEPLKTCERCGGKPEKLVSSPAIQFKGNGWYITDYARKSTPAETEKPADAKPAGDAKSAAKDSPAPAD